VDKLKTYIKLASFRWMVGVESVEGNRDSFESSQKEYRFDKIMISENKYTNRRKGSCVCAMTKLIIIESLQSTSATNKLTLMEI
jgi:hypothetical protein